MRGAARGILVSTLALAALLSAAVRLAGAQGGGWSDPQDVSNSDRLSTWPEVIADPYGMAHLFWAEEVDSQRGHAGNAIFYARWDGRSWSQPNDLFFGSAADIVEFPVAAIDPSAVLHLAWKNGGRVLYSRVPAHAAGSAAGWAEPVALVQDLGGGYYPLDIAAGPGGALYLAYVSSSFEGAYAIHSTDGGHTWSEPARIAPMPGLNPANLRMACDGRGRVHVAWAQAPASGYSEAVYYSRSEDQGKHWTPVRVVGRRDGGDYKADWIAVGAVGDHEIHLVWMDGPGAGRYHQWSSDGGQTWSAPQEFLPKLIGESGHSVLLVDSLGRLHHFAVQRTRLGQVHGLYRATWLGDRWSEGERVTSSSLWLAATIVGGDQVVAASHYEQANDIFAVTGRVLAPHWTPAPTPAATLSPTVAGPVRAGAPIVTVTPSPAGGLPGPLPPASPATSSASQVALLAGVVPATLLVIGVVIFRAARSGRR